MTESSNPNPPGCGILKFVTPLCAVLLTGTIIFAVIDNRNRQEKAAQEAREMTSKVMNSLNPVQKIAKDSTPEIASLRAHISAMESEIEILKAKSPATNSATTKEVKALSEDLENFKGAITTNFNELVISNNEQNKALESLMKRFEAPASNDTSAK